MPELPSRPRGVERRMPALRTRPGGAGAAIRNQEGGCLMPVVPWIRLYQNWPRHKKTMALRRALGTAEPILCLWLWAAENAPTGDLGGMTTEEIEEASVWQGKRGKAAAAMIEVGFIDVIPEGGMKLHNWDERAGKGVASLLKGRERSRDVMRNRRRNVNDNRPRNRVDNIAKTLLLSPDPDLSTSGSSVLSASDPDPARSIGPTSKSAYDWLAYFQTQYWIIRKRQYGQGTADMTAMGNFGDLLASLPPEQRAADWLARERIIAEFLNRTDPRTVTAGWPFAFFATDFRGLAVPPSERPKPDLRGGTDANGRPRMQARY